MAGARFAIRPSTLGGKGLLLFCALELAFLATNYSNLFFLLLAFSAVLGVLGAAWSWTNLKDVAVDAVRVTPAAAGSERRVHVCLRARRRLRFDVAVVLPLRAGRAEVAHAHALRGAAAVEGDLAAQPRGVERLEHLLLQSRFPFGFFVVTRRVHAPLEVVTHPAPAPLEQPSRAGGASGQGDGALVAGRGAALAGLRPFRAGDAVGDVHWRATARRGEAVVKERERDGRALVQVRIDRRADAMALERALSQATTLVLAARAGAPVQLLSQGADLLVRDAAVDAEPALTWLAEAAALPADGPPPPRAPGALRLPEASRTQP
jgi:uncharacterized protein (DUF58 family)